MLKVQALSLSRGISTELLKSGKIEEISTPYAMIFPENKISKLPKKRKVKLSELAGKKFLRDRKMKDRTIGEATVIEIKIRLPMNSAANKKSKKVNFTYKTQKVITFSSVEDLGISEDTFTKTKKKAA